MRRLLATRLPRQSLFTGASDVADAVFVTEPRKASDQAASKGGKVGPSTLQCMCFDPTSDGRVWRALVPSRELASAAADAAPPRLMAGVMVNTSMKGAPETNRKSGVGVENAFGSFLDGLYRADGEVVCRQATISQLRLPVVQASATSTPDSVGGFHLHEDDFVPLRVREYQGSVFSFLEASRRRSQPDPVSLWACCCGVCEPRTSLCLWTWRRARTSNLARWRADPHEHSYEQGAGLVGSRRRAAG